MDVEQVAVVGMSGRFPGAKTIDQFWQNLCNGVESRTLFSDEELIEAVGSELVQFPGYVKSGFVLDDIDQFDADFFGFDEKQARITDPQQRLFLECAWEALEGAGIDITTYGGLVGVYAGASHSNYWSHARAGLDLAGGNMLAELIGNDKDYLATQTAYRLNLQGPCMSVQSACSTGLVAVHLGCQSLLSHECDVALAGGVTVHVPHRVGYPHMEGSVFSTDGRCRAFDAQATGMVFGNGIGVVALKRLSDALADGDPIWAVVRGSAVNNDGVRKFGFMTSSRVGQIEVINEAWGIAGVTAHDLSYIETHGSGTPIGDVIEFSALASLFEEVDPNQNSCAVGSVKSNVGHLETAAGITGFIKTVLALHNQQIPPSINFETPNPDIHFERTPLYLNSSLIEWPASQKVTAGSEPRCAGVSSFGIGGTNAHVVLQEAPQPVTTTMTPQKSASSRLASRHVLNLSAKNEQALHALAQRYCDFLSHEAKENLARHEFADICYTANVGRSHFPHRLSISATSATEAQEAIRAYLDGQPYHAMQTGVAGASPPKVAFLFNGDKTRLPALGCQLYSTYPAFREALDRCHEILLSYQDDSLLSIIDSIIDNQSVEPTAELSTDASIADEAGVDELIVDEFVVDEFVVDEFVVDEFVVDEIPKQPSQPSPTISVLFSIEYALASLWESWGTEAHVVMGKGAGEYVAACVAGVFSLEDALKLVSVCSRLMQVGTHQPNPAATQISYETPTIPVLDGTSGSLITNEVTQADFWAIHLANGQIDQSAMDSSITDPSNAEESVSEKSSRLKESLASQGIPFVVETAPDESSLLATLSALYVSGGAIDWVTFEKVTDQTTNQTVHRQKVPLPTYPFQRKRHWVDLGSATSGDELGDGLDETAAALSSGISTEPTQQTSAEETIETVSTLSTKSQERTQPVLQGYPAIGHQLITAPETERTDLLLAYLRKKVAQTLQQEMPEQDVITIPMAVGFAELGMTSLNAVALRETLQADLGYPLPATLVLDYPTINALHEYLSQNILPRMMKEGLTLPPTSPGQEQAESQHLAPQTPSHHFETQDATINEPIAIIGIGCRFPGAENPAQFWQMLIQGRDGVAAPSANRWHSANGENELGALGLPGEVEPVAGFLDQIDQFDPLFFRISPREALHIDPEQRLLLEVAWEALEHAGINPQSLVNSPTGVFIGQIGSPHTADEASSDSASKASEEDSSEVDGANQADLQSTVLYSMTGSLSGFAPGRLSYFLGTQGPSLAVDCSCSASLLSVHLAVQSLRLGECTMALAGGVSLLPDPEIVAALSQWQLLTADGRTKTFDATADGYGLGEGCGMVVLKRLSDAQKDGDSILALVRGSATNHDGPSSGLTVPNGRAQQAVVRQALKNADIAPSEVGYIEANGIGTPLGDTMEADALGNVFQSEGTAKRTQPIWLGAASPNVGHLDAAAAMPSFIKAILAVQQGEIPPTVNFHEPNPLIDWDNLPLKVPTMPIPWTESKRVAGVSSFGLSGSNVHVVLEQPPQGISTTSHELSVEQTNESESHPEERPLHLLTLSAKTESALKTLAAHYARTLRQHPEFNLTDICHTANAGRAHFQHRLSIVAKSRSELEEKLDAASEGQRKMGLLVGKAPENRPQIAFLFSGMGTQSIDMGRQLYETQPTFRRAVDQCNDILQEYLDTPLLDVLYSGLKGEQAVSGQVTSEQGAGTVESPPHPSPKLVIGDTPSPPHGATLLSQPLYAETALFTLEYALATLWQSWGVEPDVMVGHSAGEFVAACIAGVFSLEDSLKLVAERGRLIQAASSAGATASIFATQDQVEGLIQPYPNEISLAGVNSPEEVLIAGAASAVDQVLADAQEAGLDGRRLNVAHAAHSPLMDPILDEFEQIAQSVSYNPPRIKLISSVSGEVCHHMDAAYWRAHLREPVRFAQSIATLQETDCTLMVEIGPQPVLLWLGRQNWTGTEDARWLGSLRSIQTDWQQMTQSLSELYVQGAPVDWCGFDNDYTRHKVVLPTYPFQRQRISMAPVQRPAQGQEQKSFQPNNGICNPAEQKAPATKQRTGLANSSTADNGLPGLPVSIKQFEMRQLPTTSDEWWYHAKQTSDGQWTVQIFDGEGHCVAETAGERIGESVNALPDIGHSSSVAKQPAPYPVPSPAERGRILGAHDHHTLPNGLQIAHLNPYETDYVYQEIFVDRCYMKHGISLHEGDTVIDIGANIGLFSLFVQQEAPNVRVYSFEPSPPAFQALQINTSLYVPGAKVFNCGIADTTREATFTFYKNSSVFSSFQADVESDRAAIRTVVENMVAESMMEQRASKGSNNGQNGEISAIDPNELESIVNELMDGRMESQSIVCQLHSLSDIIQAEQIGQIDLLKVDAEKSEVAVLQGIRDEDWPKIQQIVIEVHEQEDAVLEQVTAILRQQGFDFAVEEETFLQNSGLYNIFATRPRQDISASDTNQLHSSIESIMEQLAKVSQDERPLILVEHLRTEVAMVVGMDPSLVDVANSLLSLGVDSLLAIEMRNQIRKALPVPQSALPITTVLENSITALSGMLIDLLEIPPSQNPAQISSQEPSSGSMNQGTQPATGNTKSQQLEPTPNADPTPTFDSAPGSGVAQERIPAPVLAPDEIEEIEGEL